MVKQPPLLPQGFPGELEQDSLIHHGKPPVFFETGRRNAPPR